MLWSCFECAKIQNIWVTWLRILIKWSELPYIYMSPMPMSFLVAWGAFKIGLRLKGFVIPLEDKKTSQLLFLKSHINSLLKRLSFTEVGREVACCPSVECGGYFLQGSSRKQLLKTAVSALDDKNLVGQLCSVKFLLIREGTWASCSPWSPLHTTVMVVY